LSCSGRPASAPLLFWHRRIGASAHRRIGVRSISRVGGIRLASFVLSPLLVQLSGIQQWGRRKGRHMKGHLPTLLALAVSASAWSCGSSDTSEPAGAAGTASGLGGNSGIAGNVGNAAAGLAAAGSSVGGSATAVGGSAGSANSGAGGLGMGTAGSSNGGAGVAGSPSGGAGVAGSPGGGAANGGASGMGGGSAAGASASGASGMCLARASTDTRPQLVSGDAAKYTILKYLAASDNWDPTAGLGNASAFIPNFTVASDGSGTHTSVQAAINAAASGSARRYILIKPGSYRGVVSYSSATPITLYGLDADASKVVIVNSASAADAGGTDKSATFTSKANGLQLLNLTVSNDYPTPATGTNIQAVALYVTGDKTVLQNVRLHGFQDTLFTDIPSETATSRVYIKNSFIEGDTDFIFGAATLVIDGSSINYLSSRKTSGGGACLAPSTRVSKNFGFLVINSHFTAAANAIANKVSLGRSWDEGGVSPTPNGQAVVRETVLGAHIRKVDPWAAAATSGRPFSATGNRFSEYCNSGVGSGP
jgi:pectinesterase